MLFCGVLDIAVNIIFKRGTIIINWIDKSCKGLMKQHQILVTYVGKYCLQRYLNLRGKIVL